jgi:hypothetical protein
MGGGTRNCLKETIAPTLTSSADCDFTLVLTRFRVVMNEVADAQAGFCIRKANQRSARTTGRNDQSAPLVGAPA